jgi:nucleoside-diphosphate-sugar epimerase
MENAIGKKAVVEYGPPNTADMFSNWADVSKAERLLGWKPRIGLNEGVRQLVNWYQRERAWAKDIVTA